MPVNSTQKNNPREKMGIPEFLTVNEVAQLFKISRTSVYRLARGDIRYFRIKAGLRFAKQDILAYLKGCVTETLEVATVKMIVKESTRRKRSEGASPDTNDVVPLQLDSGKGEPLPKLLDINEVAVLFNVPKTTIYRLVANRSIRVYRIHGHLNFEEREVVAYLEGQRGKPENERFFIASHRSHPNKKAI